MVNENPREDPHLQEALNEYKEQNEGYSPDPDAMGPLPVTTDPIARDLAIDVGRARRDLEQAIEDGAPVEEIERLRNELAQLKTKEHDYRFGNEAEDEDSPS